MSETRMCKRCGVEYPATTEYFTTSKGKGNNDNRYLKWTCRKCTNSDVNARYHRVVKYETAKKKELEGPKVYVHVCKLLPYSIELDCYLKTCSVCKRTLPAAKEYFYPSKGGKLGVGGQCKECRGFKFTPAVNVADGYTRCSKCNTDFITNEDNFYAKKGSPTGFSKICRTCHKKQDAQYRQDNLATVRERDRLQDIKRKEFKKIWRYQKYWENPELYAQKNKENHAKHLKKRLAYGKEKYRNNPELSRELHKKWKTENPEAYRLSVNKCRQKRRAEKRKLPHDFTAEQWISCKEYFDNTCAYCGEDTMMDHDLDQEHFVCVENYGGYTVSNILPACRSCNSRKHTSWFEDWYLSDVSYSPEREEKILAYLNLTITKRNEQLSLFEI